MTGLRFLLGAYGARVLAGLIAAAALLAVADLTELAPHLADRPDALALGLRLYAAKAPALVLQALPLALLFGVLLAVADLARNRELLALRASGAGPVRIAAPGLLLAAALGLAAIPFAETVAPLGTREATYITTRQLGRYSHTWTLFHKPRSWYLGTDGALYRVGKVAEGGRLLTDLTRYDRTPGRVSRMAGAATARFTDDGWTAEGATVWELDRRDPAQVRVTTDLPIDAPPRHFGGIPGLPEELTFAELRQAIDLRRSQGQPTLPLEVEAHARRAMPLVGFGLVVLALGFALRLRAPETPVAAVGWGMGIAFVGWTLLAAARALGLAGVLTPWLAAWTPVLVPVAVGAALFLVRR